MASYLKLFVPDGQDETYINDTACHIKNGEELCEVSTVLKAADGKLVIGFYSTPRPRKHHGATTTTLEVLTKGVLITCDTIIISQLINS